MHHARADLKADAFAALARLLSRLFEEVHRAKLTRQQHLMFRLATLTTLVETGAALCRKIAEERIPLDRPDYLQLCARINAALSAQEAFAVVNEVLYGSGHWSEADAQALLAASGFDYPASQSGLIADMDLLRTML